MTARNRRKIRELEKELKETQDKPINGISYRQEAINEELSHRHSIESRGYNWIHLELIKLDK